MQRFWDPAHDYHPDLRTSRLVQVADVLRSVWLRVSELHEPETGDDMWVMSCRAFRRCGHRLLVAQQDWHWLSFTESRRMQYVINIGAIPARYYHGDSTEDVPVRYAEPPDSEKVLRQGVLSFDGFTKGLLRFVTKTDSRGVPLSVTLVEYDPHSNATINRFKIPEIESAAPAEPIPFPGSQPKPGVEQAKPSARPRTGRVKNRSGYDDSDQHGSE